MTKTSNSDDSLPLKNINNLPCWCGEGGQDPVVFHSDSDSLIKAHLHCYRCDKSDFDSVSVKNYLDENEGKIPQRYKRRKRGKMVQETRDNIDTRENLPSYDEALKLGNKRIVALIDRGISQKAAEKYKVRSWFDEDGKLLVRSFDFVLKDAEGDGDEWSDDLTVTAQKFKNSHKNMTILKLNQDAENFRNTKLFGEDKFPKGCNNILTLTEGEEDALAAWDILQNANKQGRYFETPVVSVNSGAANAKKDCQRNWEYLNSFNEIRICFDNDEPGRKAAREVATLFPKKARIVNLTDHKDVNDYLKKKDQDKFLNRWFNPEKLTIQGILPSSALWDDMIREDNFTSVPFPWEGMNKYLFGLRTGEMLVWKAPPKVGKTAILRALQYHILTSSDENMGIISFEETTKGLALAFCSLNLEKALRIPTTEYTEQELEQAYDAVLKKDRFFLFDPKGDRSYENVMEKIHHLVKAYECRYIFLDHISMLAYDSGDDLERKFLDKASADLKNLTTELDIHISVVTHVNDEGKTRGSRALYQLCDGLIDLKRDKLNPDKIKANTMELTVEENRISGDSGLACKLFYNADTTWLEELDVEEEEVEAQKEYQYNKEKPREVSFDDDDDDE